ncbi:hypothetical protein EW145_g5511 [Phellinidium pouzarii]|uniref:Fe2OG dioxygenase domain-containing protein n=1 Tax=Phellinidium pouzarii TaxID=167371 RepID=A0A4S4KZY2_9AGAM|nr:hypothetical protein EW145_g5511 [Phellinidium pouzarii]
MKSKGAMTYELHPQARDGFKAQRHSEEYDRNIIRLKDRFRNGIVELKAVEPSEGMRAVFSNAVKDARVSLSEGTFDRTGVQNDWADLIVIATQGAKRVGWVTKLWDIPAQYDPLRLHQTEQWRGLYASPLYEQYFQPSEERVFSHDVPSTSQAVTGRVLSWSAIVPLEEQEKVKVKENVLEIMNEGEGLEWIDQEKGLLKFPHDTLVVVIRRKIVVSRTATDASDFKLLAGTTMSNDDTEILLVSLISLLEPHNIPAQSELLDALVDCDGDVEAAAQRLRQSSTRSTAVKKRKRAATDLKDWLTISSAKTSDKRAKTITSTSSIASESPNLTSSSKPHSLGPSLKPQSAGSSSRPRSTGSLSHVKPVDLMSVLRAPAPDQPTVVRNPPLTLSNPAMVAQHTPCTLHYSILPPELACELYYTMLDAAQGWSRNKWWLFDRIVVSPHLTSFFARVDGFELEGEPEEAWKEAAQLWYNGRKSDPPHPFPEEMEAAFPLEWGGSSGTDGMTWRANVAAANCYQGTKEGVGFHSDQLTNLGPYPTIASLSLGTTRIFRLREVVPSIEADKRHARTYNVPLPHNSLIIMHASTQERFKHCIPQLPAIDVFHPPFPRRRIPGMSLEKSQLTSSPASPASVSVVPSTPSNVKPHSRKKLILDSPAENTPSSNCRINITFRFYRPDFAATKIPRCKCGVPCILRPDMKHRVDRREDDIKGTQIGEDIRNENLKGKGKEGGTEERGVPSSKNRNNRKDHEDREEYHIKYWWTCYAGVQNDGKGCGMWKVMDVKAEGRGPFISDLEGLHVLKLEPIYGLIFEDIKILERMQKSFL